MWTEKRRYWVSGLAMIFLGMFFVVAATGKLLSRSTAFDLFAFPSFVSPAMAEAIYTSIPYIELVVGMLLILGVAVKFATSLSVFLILGFVTSNILLISQGIQKCANCFGVAGSFTPTASLVLDGIMAVLIVVIFLCHRGSFFSITPWLLGEIPEGRESEYVKSSFATVNKPAP